MSTPYKRYIESVLDEGNKSPVVDLHGRKFTNAGKAVSSTDYITLAEVQRLIANAITPADPVIPGGGAITFSAEVSTVTGVQNSGFTLALPFARNGVFPYTYFVSNLPLGLTFDSDSRIISGIPIVHGSFLVTYTATDSDTPTASGAIQFLIEMDSDTADPTVDLTLPSVGTHSAIINRYFNFVLPEATGGTAPYIYSIAGLPLGLSFNAITRTISGSPTESGGHMIVYTVVDNVNDSDTEEFTLTVLDPSSNVLRFNPFGPFSTIENVYFDSGEINPLGGVGAITYAEVTGLPTGIENTGVGAPRLTGRATTPGIYSIVISASDSADQVASLNFTITVNPVNDALVTFGVHGPFRIIRGRDYGYPTETITPITGDSPFTYEVTGLPDGMNFELNEGGIRLINNPTVNGVYIVTITATDNDGDEGSVAITLNIEENLVPVMPNINNLQSTGVPGISTIWTSATGVFSGNNPLVVSYAPLNRAILSAIIERVGNVIPARHRVRLQINLGYIGTRNYTVTLTDIDGNIDSEQFEIDID